jgi:hypothetical protein
MYEFRLNQNTNFPCALLALLRNAVKKFVYENQGLVRRMYGDMRHIFVMQSEIENEVDFDDIQHSADKYSKAFNSHNQQRQMKARKAPVDRKNFRSDTEPYFRPAQRPSVVNSKQKTKPPKVAANEQPDSNMLLDNMIKSNIDAIVVDLKAKEDNVSDVTQKTTKLTSVSSQSSTTPTTIPSTHPDQLSYEQSTKSALRRNDTSSIDRELINLFSNISSALSTTTSSSLNTTTIASDAAASEESKDKLSSTLKNELTSSNAFDKVEQELEDEVLNDLEQVASSVGETLAENEDRNSSKEPQTTTTETQLFQDTVVKEKEPAPVVNRRGV